MLLSEKKKKKKAVISLIRNSNISVRAQRNTRKLQVPSLVLLLQREEERFLRPWSEFLIRIWFRVLIRISGSHSDSTRSASYSPRPEAILSTLVHFFTIQVIIVRYKFLWIEILDTTLILSSYLHQLSAIRVSVSALLFICDILILI